MKDEDGQPLNKWFYCRRVGERKVDELMGLCKGIISDGIVNQREVEFIKNWLYNNQDVSDKWPANVLYKRIEKMLKDRFLDDEEAKELLDFMIQMTGVINSEEKISDAILSTSLLLTKPVPKIIFNNNKFCLTGKFLIDTRKNCEKMILEREGLLVNSPTLDTNYLVIGMLQSIAWIHTTYGRKIEKALEMVKNGKSIKIVSEETFTKYL
ncbi:MAG TPA: hypothetical protein VJL89_03725 [Thermodesulfovibrionia bacterium]|nr:hypothetical protein [Thermodesulfovibrionia bacterium]